jgi:hypothetical protein
VTTAASPRRTRVRLDTLPRIRRRAARHISAGLRGDMPADEVHDLVAALAVLARLVQAEPGAR